MRLFVLAAALLCCAAGFAEEKIPVKVLVLTMFEVGENKGDFAGEFQHWFVEYLDNAPSFSVNGADSPVFVNADGVAGTVVGMGKARSGASLMAILSDPRFDFSKTYFVVSGCSGTAPSRGTLGSVFICDWLVDYELGHSWRDADAVPGVPAYMSSNSYKDSALIELNRELVEWAVHLTKGLELRDDPGAEAYRQKYIEEPARGKPLIMVGASVTADSYWHGRGASAMAEYICYQYGASKYGVTQMEDNAFGVVLKAMGGLDRLLVVRDAVNFDQPYPGQSVKQSLESSSGSFSIGMFNGFSVGSTVVNHIINEWDTWKEGVPAAPKSE